MKRMIWCCIRLAIADAAVILGIVMIGLCGLMMLIFGAPKEDFNCCEIIEAAKSFIWIAALIAVVCFFAEYFIHEKGDH